MEFFIPDNNKEKSSFDPPKLWNGQEADDEALPPDFDAAANLALQLNERFNEIGFDPLRDAKDIDIFRALFFISHQCLLVRRSGKTKTHRFLNPKPVKN